MFRIWQLELQMIGRIVAVGRAWPPALDQAIGLGDFQAKLGQRPAEDDLLLVGRRRPASCRSADARRATRASRFVLPAFFSSSAMCWSSLLERGQHRHRQFFSGSMASARDYARLQIASGSSPRG